MCLKCPSPLVFSYLTSSRLLACLVQEKLWSSSSSAQSGRTFQRGPSTQCPCWQTLRLWELGKEVLGPTRWEGKFLPLSVHLVSVSLWLSVDFLHKKNNSTQLSLKDFWEKPVNKVETNLLTIGTQTSRKKYKKNIIKDIFKKYFKKSEVVYQLHSSVMFRWTFCSAPHHSCVFIQQWDLVETRKPAWVSKRKELVWYFRWCICIKISLKIFSINRTMASAGTLMVWTVTCAFENICS